MKLNSLIASLLLLISISSVAQVSATRNPSEKFQQARFRHSLQKILDVQIQGQSAWDSSVRLENVDFSAVSDLGSMEKLNEVFQYIRDTKFVDKQPQPLTERRLSWLYPDDGCYTRAALAEHFTKKQNMAPAYKLFIFGDLAVKSQNHPNGVVHWWYHVVPVYRVGKQAYVIDPAIDGREAMTVEAWKKAMETENPVDQFAVCKPQTIDPDDNCQNPKGQSIESLLRYQRDFLVEEWYRVQTLGRSPEMELGDSPPWK